MTETLQNLSNIAIAVGIFLTALGGYGSYFYGKRLEKEKDVAANSREIRLISQIEGLSNTTKALESRLDPFEKLATTLYPNMQVEVAMEKLRQDTLELRKKTEDIERRTQQRKLSAEQSRHLSDELKKISGWKVRVDVVMNDQEAVAFADALADVFRTGGWVVEGVNQAVWSKPVFGAFIFAGENSPEAQFVARLLINSNLPLTPVLAKDVGDKQLVVRIGARQ